MSVQIQVSGQWVTVADVLPVGAIIEISNVLYIYTGNAAASLWLPCNGAAVSRTTYSALFQAISTTFGSGDGSTTFNVPNVCQLELRPVVVLTTGQTMAAFVGDTDVTINCSSAASLDISYGATVVGAGFQSPILAQETSLFLQSLGVDQPIRMRSFSQHARPFSSSGMAPAGTFSLVKISTGTGPAVRETLLHR